MWLIEMVRCRHGLPQETRLQALERPGYGGMGRKNLRKGTGRSTPEGGTTRRTYRRSGPKGTWLKFPAVRWNANGTDGAEIPCPPEAATM